MCSMHCLVLLGPQKFMDFRFHGKIISKIMEICQNDTFGWYILVLGYNCILTQLIKKKQKKECR